MENKWEEYEYRKKSLGWLKPEEYDKAIRQILEDLGL